MQNKCAICLDVFGNTRKLSKHVRDCHKIGSQTYYDAHLRTHLDGQCEFCGSPTKFLSILEGYRQSCNQCKAEKAKQFRAINKADEAKHTAFVNKVKVNQTQIWKNRKATGEDTVIRTKIGQTITSNNSQLSKKDLSEKFGWLNKLTPTEKVKWIQTVMIHTGCHAWWKQASAEDIQQLVVKRMSTIAQVSKELVMQAHKCPEDYSIYNAAAVYITHNTYAKFRHVIDPDNLRGPDWHLDHIYSIKVGFINKVDPYIIGSVHNLRIIPKAQNLQKHMKCDLTLEELMEKFNE